MRFLYHNKNKNKGKCATEIESLGNVRPEQVKRTARELLSLYADKFTTNFSDNKEAIKSLTNIPSAKLRNRVAGYVTRLMSMQVAQTSQSEEAE